MNAKRQTVWLVSMLSLMVVLSAYYLFTEDVNEFDLASQELKGSEIKVDAVQNAGSDSAAKTGNTDVKAKETSATVKTGTTDAAKKTDQEVLKQVQAQGSSGSDFIKSAQMKRNDELSKQTEKWMKVSMESKNNDEINKAIEELNKIQDMDAKLTNLEDQLSKQYKNAVVLQEAGKWKVIVQAAKLEKSQGVSIVDLVMKEMSVGADKVTIQYVQ
jgi:stage III sporulation protein AH